MTRPGVALAAAGLLASVLLAAPCAASDAQSGPLPRGGSYVISRDPGIAAAAVTLWFRAPSAGYDDATPGIARLAATAAAAAPLISGRSLAEFVHDAGGTLQINAYPDIVGIDAVVPSTAARRTVAALTAAFFAPRIDAAAMQAARRDTAVASVEQRYSSTLALHNAVFAALFASGPAHYPPVPFALAALTHITTAQVVAFAQRAFRSGNAVLAMAGNVDSSAITAVTDGAGASTMDAPHDSPLTAAPASASVSGAIDGVGIGWVGPPIADERAATALDFVADYLFRDGTGVIARLLAREQPASYATGQFITLHDPGVMLVTLEGGADAKAKALVLAAVDRMRRPLDPTAFAAAREAFLYHLATDTQLPQEQADNLGWYAVEGNPAYAPGSASGMYRQIARGLDAAYVASVVRRYLSSPVVITMAPAVRESAS